MNSPYQVSITSHTHTYPPFLQKNFKPPRTTFEKINSSFHKHMLLPSPSIVLHTLYIAELETFSRCNFFAKGERLWYLHTTSLSSFLSYFSKVVSQIILKTSQTSIDKFAPSIYRVLFPPPPLLKCAREINRHIIKIIVCAFFAVVHRKKWATPAPRRFELTTYKIKNIARKYTYLSCLLVEENRFNIFNFRYLSCFMFIIFRRSNCWKRH